MIRSVAVIGIAALSMGAAPAPQAAPAGDAAAAALGNCMVLKTTGEDRLVVARWMVTAMASGPQLADAVSVNAGKKPTYDKDMATLFTRLLVRDCADQSRPVFKTGGDRGFKIAGEALGKVAMEELLRDPKALGALTDYAKYLKQDDFKPVLP
ncbi:hypothetical protein M9980_00800 [Sphingomonas donggukensis]|uniref:Uncharacterized protein n=1 Tax=Sphingomonas donggukensis TaxID=2949093 RepID=A0ABY4TZQ6_9SPHN|nr:hypothetical protein [Sphingomonas donggukensis]URW75808.1 hypothetical protein M9980_00800 [Sphingomonas donggukensis]